jgi:chromate transporter
VLWVIAALAFVAIFAFSAPFPAIVLAAAIIGYVGGRVAPREFAVGGVHRAGGGSHAPAIIDDDTPTPAHARFRWSRLLGVTIVCLALWALALGSLIALQGSGPLLQMAIFFSKAALLTFGGAYSVLPYVYQGRSRRSRGSRGQMIDGWALAKRRRAAHLIVAFVGFVGAWTKAVFGPRALGLRGHRRRIRGNLLHVPAELLLHPSRWATGRNDPRPTEIHRTADRRSLRRSSA